MTIVSVKQVPEYDARLLDEAIAAHFEAVGVREILSPGMKLVLKPNLLAARAPSQATTTHPEFLAAVLRMLHDMGISDITLADTPGGAITQAGLDKLYSACGLKELSSLCKLNDDLTSVNKGGFPILKVVAEADGIVNCAKLKTHALTVMTGCVKNLFGCIPGLKKPETHCTRPTVDSFGNFLMDLSETIAPQLHLMDAIECMEGNGPGGGTKRPMGVTLCSRNPYALDEQGMKVMGLRHVPLVDISRSRGLLPTDTVLMGDSLPVADPPFTLPDAVQGKEHFLTPSGIFHCFFGHRRSFPLLKPDKCVGCGRCAESCPKHIITIESGKAVFPRKGCISCFCCQEMCPCHAIGVQKKLW